MRGVAVLSVIFALGLWGVVPSHSTPVAPPGWENQFSQPSQPPRPEAASLVPDSTEVESMVREMGALLDLNGEQRQSAFALYLGLFEGVEYLLAEFDGDRDELWNRMEALRLMFLSAFTEMLTEPQLQRFERFLAAQSDAGALEGR